MIDFRYHLISLVGVILALALGILAGSGFLGGPFLDRLQRDVHRAEERNVELQQRIRDQDALLAQHEAFARASAPLLIGNQLAGEDVVVLEIAESDGGLGEETRRSIVEANGQVVSEIIFEPKLAMTSAPAVDELSLITGALAGDPETLRESAGTLIGPRAAAAAAEGAPPPGASNAAEQRLTSLLADLENAGFVSTVAPDNGAAVVPGASFVIVGGGEDRAPFEPGRFVTALASALADQEAAVLVVEPTTSTWGLVASVRRDIEARANVATVDNGETTLGQVALVLGLDEAIEGTVGHFGTSPGSAIIPAAAND
ncbi:MAG TPA: copper transporter [Actinomycetota bacterium]|nr:copper transporter [Actinomycetota bacterium]